MANGRSQGYQVAVIIFAILTVICFVIAVVMWKSKSDQTADLNAAKKAAQEAERTAQQANSDLSSLKKLIRAEFEEMQFAELATIDPGGTLTGGLIYQDLNQLEADTGTEPYQDYSHALQAYADRIDNLTAQLNNLQADNVDMEENNVLRDQVTAAAIQVEENAREQAEQLLAEREAAFQEDIREKDALTNQYRATAETALTEKGQLEIDFEQREAENARIIRDQRNQMDLQNERLKTFEEADFERGDGQIVYVSSRLGLVWINLGSADNLPKQQTFSIYASDAMNVAKKRKKADIEVTGIRSAHLAEARITNYGAKAGDPILEGDIIYTPLWSPGRKLRFALAGLIDLDGDGEDDRDTVRDVIENAGAEIVAELLENGEIRTRSGGIDINTKYLILGERPEANARNATIDTDLGKVLKGISQMVEAARNAGVEIIGVEEFLEQVGYQPHRRLVKPGSIRISSPRRTTARTLRERANLRRPGNGLLDRSQSQTSMGGY